MEQVLRVGTIGNGFIAEEFIDALKKVDGASLEAIYLREEDKDCGFSEKVGANKVYYDVEEMLDDKEINCIYVALPNVLHYFRVKQALLAGKHVICEKPFTPNVEEAKELLEIAKQQHVCVFEAMSIIHMPNYHHLKKRLKDVGDLCLVVANYSQRSSKYDKLKKGEHINVFDPVFAGGTLMDLNCYNIYTTIALFGKPDKVYFAARKYMNGIDLSGIVTMEYPAFNAVCVGAKDCNGVNYYQVQGDQGYLCVNEGINGVSSVEVCIGDKKELINLQKEKNRLYYEVKDFMEIIKNKEYKKCYDGMEESIQVIAVMEECLSQIGVHYKSINAGVISL